MHAPDQRLSERKLPASALQSLEAQRSKLAAASGELDAVNQQMIDRAINESFVHAFQLLMVTGATLAVASAIVSLIFIGGVARQVKWT
jgi:hypothetical protein